MAKIIDGKAISAEVKTEIAEQTAELIASTGITPGLAVVIVGDDPASKIYVRNKGRACEQVGFFSETHELPENTDQETLENLIDTLNSDPKIHGILVQLPLPQHLDADRILMRISPDKDVDAFHPYNVGRLTVGTPTMLPCTPSGIIELLRRSGIEIAGKECVVLGRSNIVGKPMALLLLAENGTVTVCHSGTRKLVDICRRADILVSAVGKAGFVRADMVKEGAVVIDVGMNRDAEGRLVGDVDFDAASERASYITPVPGGVGPMTIAMLMRNTLNSARIFAKRAEK